MVRGKDRGKEIGGGGGRRKKGKGEEGDMLNYKDERNKGCRRGKKK